MKEALPRLRAGGYLYLDNSDAEKDWARYTSTGMRKVAQRILEETAAAGGGTIECFRGLSPATLHVSKGILFRKR